MDDGHGYRKSKKSTEKILRQFLNIDGPHGATPAYRSNYDLAFGRKEAAHDVLVKPAHCDKCDYVANTITEILWHEDHNPGHEVCPDNK